ncbi:8-oxo-dGTP pyrophosphatase MutT, NUDIX family [Pedobacter steynii]|uniref:GDP-mannose pyrophosphatase n=2 Tax=Pedobacter steynii TaxID=430522 RepID=A0A1H0F733_9SPHI|nr:8-oxo-dGTP pyrophosphatase MutT, NUDIX family [Pedobacter steynii]
MKSHFSIFASMEEHNPWTTIESRKIYDNNWIGLTEHQVINPSGGKGIYGEVHFKNLAIGILPLDEELNTWLVGQYRFPLKAYSWEIPEGGGPLGSDPLDSAKRELQEETGLSATDWVELQRMHLSNSVSNELAIIYIARGLSMGIAEPEETEELRLRKLPFQEAYEMVLNGEITDSMSVAAILKTKIILQEYQL